MKKLAVLVSGGGTNLQAVIDACKSGEINGQIAVVISSNDEAYAIVRAKTNHIPSEVCSIKKYGSREKRDAEVLKLLKEYAVDYVILAGYLGIIPEEIIKEFPSKIVNIHPALLPKFGGKDFYGIKVHQAVIGAGETESGATAHFVTGELDGGPIICQQKLTVYKGDTAETLQKRILNEIEHPMIISVVKSLCE